MPDPISVGIATAVAGGMVDSIRNYIENADNPEEAWEEASQECVIRARASFRQNYKEVNAYDFTSLKSEVSNIGLSAREIEVRGEVMGFSEDLAELMGNFATACADYGNAASYNTFEQEDEFENQLDELGQKILDETS